VRALGWVLATLLRLLAATWRSDSTASQGLVGGSGPPQLVGFWHGKYFALLALLRGTRGRVLIGAGFRGEVIAAICESLGYTPILLPHGDRERALGEMRVALREGPLSATALDGPVGPARHVKPALLRLAADAGVQIRPVSVIAAPRLVLRWRWDRREIPLPLARVRLVVGEPIAIPKGASDRELEEWQREVAHRVDEIERPSHRVRFPLFALIAVGVMLGASAPLPSSGGSDTVSMSFALRSSAFADGEEIPTRYTCEGEDVSPPLAWSAPPPGTRSLALVVDDPDAPDPRAPRMTWVHWIVVDLPPTEGSLPDAVAPRDLPGEARMGRNDWKRADYGGPCPPIGRHRYLHKLYALDVVLARPEAPTKAEFERASAGHVLAKAVLVGTYAKHGR
jgi:Raf kinase inhibitor-like YbhB/YbcL family protein